jgi:DNA-binding response OmpR family regulator
VILLITKSDDGIKLKSSDTYADDFIVKPIETKALRAKIRKILKPRK